MEIDVSGGSDVQVFASDDGVVMSPCLAESKSSEARIRRLQGL